MTFLMDEIIAVTLMVEEIMMILLMSVFVI